MSKEALRLADRMEANLIRNETDMKAAAELRRLAALNAELVGLLREVRGSLAPTYRLSPEGRAYIEKMDATLSKAKEQA